MTFSVNFSARDFSSPVLAGLKADPIRLDWSAYGGPGQAEIRLMGDKGKLLQASRLLRCPVMINDKTGSPVWWGYVEEVIIFLEDVQISVSLEDLYNKVCVRYAFITPDHSSGEVLFTGFADDLASQSEFGVKEITLGQEGIDDDFAENLRDTFLKGSALPRSCLSQRSKAGGAYALVKCAGWLKTLSWLSYQNVEGFYANTGTGPGTFNFGQSASYQYPSQVFTPGASGSLKYAYFQLRGIGDPTRDLHAQLRDGSGTLLVTSESVSGSTLSSTAYRWTRFVFASPFDLVGGGTYMLGVTGSTTDPVRHFAIRTDENQGFPNGYGRYFNGSGWVNLPSITNPGGAPDLLFRALCITDTGRQISTIADAGSQFFTRISAPTSGILTCSFRDRGHDCLKEITALMALGTSNHRKILARVSPERQLEFYEQPEPDDPSVYMNERGDFISYQGIPRKPYFPPVGEFARYSGSSQILLPFDKNRMPVCFIERASYFPIAGRVVINSST